MKQIVFLLTVLWILQACSSEEYTKSPLDTLIRDMDRKKNFTIILYDMDVEGSFFSTYKHRYKIITEEAKNTKGDSTYNKAIIPKEKISKWYEVTKQEFDKHINDMGMEIASKTNGKLSKQTAPPGYSNYVGNSQYGEWKQGSNEHSFWHFYGQYAFMSSMMGLVAGPIYRSSYHDYTNNYRNTGRGYYGKTAGGRTLYGTHSSSVQKSNPNFYSRYNTKSNFRDKVNSSVSRSSSSASRYGGRSRTEKISRSRSSSGRSLRSRSSSRGGK